MKLSLLLFLLCELTKIYSNEYNDFIVEYFRYKHSPSVVVFSCDNHQEKILLTKKFNRQDIRIIFSTLSNASEISNIISTKYWRIGIFLNFQCFSEYQISLLFDEAQNRYLYGESHHWLVLIGNDVNDAISQVNDSAFGYSTDFAISVPVIGGYELYDIYNPWKNGGGVLKVTHLGYWSGHAGLNITLKQSKFDRRANLHGLTMKASFFASKYRKKNTSLETYLQDDSSRAKDGLSKFGYAVLRHLAEMFNFTYDFGEIKTWKPGDHIGPLSRALWNNEIQITGSPVVITKERSYIIKFVYPTWPFRTCFIFRNPQPQDIKINEILNPFATESWYLTFIFLGLFFTCLILALHFERCDLSSILYSNSFILVVGTFCQQGTHYTMDKISTRIIYIYLLLFSFLIYNYYSASIVSTRLNEPIFKINDSLSEMAKLGLKLGSEPMIYFEFLMRRVTAWDKKVFLEERWSKIPEEERFVYPEKAVPLVKEGIFAYHSHPDASYPIIDRTFTVREICELMEVHPVSPSFATIAVSYNSTFAELTTIGFAKMTEVGIRNRQLKRWTSRKPRCRKDVINVSSTDIFEFAPHLIILFIGMFLSVIIFISEKIVDQHYKYNKWDLVPSVIREKGHSVSLSYVLHRCKLK